MAPMAPAERRRAILEVAKSHFERYGFKRTRLDDIVQEVGIAKGSLYLEFAGKEELFLEVIVALHRAAVLWFDELLAKPWSPAEKLRGALRGIFRQFEQEPLFERLQMEDPELRFLRRLLQREDVPAVRDRSMEKLALLIAEGQRQGQLRPELDPRLSPVTFGLLKMFHFYSDFVEDAGFTRQQFVDETIAMAMRSVLNPGVELAPEEETELPRWRGLAVLNSTEEP